MDSLYNFKTIPIGSILSQGSETDFEYLEKIKNLPPTIKDVVTSPRTGAYLRGLAKTFNIDEDKITLVAFFVLQICIGEKTLNDLPRELITKLGIPSASAQQMAQEIEKELFAPIAMELNRYLTERKTTIQSSTNTPADTGSVTRDVPNVLDLKNKPKPPTPPWGIGSSQ